MSITLSALDRELIALIGDYAVPLTLGMARVSAIFFWLPYLSAGAIASPVARAAIAAAVVIGMWPVTQGAQLPQDMLGIAMTAATEVLIGTAIGLMVSLPFHIFYAVGAIVDNQRGASISAALDPLTGIEATETAHLLNMTSSLMFLMTGGMVSLMQVIHASYGLVPMGAHWIVNDGAVTEFLSVLLAESVRMAMPVLLVLFLVEVFLGILSRFAEQMNPFAVSLGIKSFVAFIALAMYLMWTMVDQLPALWHMHDGLELIKTAVPP
jgi:type III secretion protein SpaR/YscT/HrcT